MVFRNTYIGSALVSLCIIFLYHLAFRHPHGGNQNIPSNGLKIVTDKDYQGLDQEDPSLVAYIRTLLRSPSVKPYNLRQPNRKHYTTMEQSKFVGDLYGPGKRDGFFVEVGGFDGEGSSSTLYLEKELGFQGILIEPNVENYAKLLSKERKCYALHAALSPTNKSDELLFTGSSQQGHLVNEMGKSTIKVKSFPLYSVLQALNKTFIDVLNLDIQGFELKVLKTLPFGKVNFGVLIVEHHGIPEPKEEMIAFMKEQGYEKIHQNVYDYIFGKPEYLKKLPGWKA